MLLIDDILLSPLKGVLFLGKKIDEIIQKESADEGKIKERLMALQMRLELNEISPEEYDRQEGELLGLLEKAIATKERNYQEGH